MRGIIIDDSSVIRTVASRILANHADVALLEAPTARSGYDICADNLPDLVIIDSDLPDEKGIELLERISELNHRGKASIILLLSEVDLSAIMRAKRAGASGFLLKPFDRDTVLDVLGPLLRHKADRAEAA